MYYLASMQRKYATCIQLLLLLSYVVGATQQYRVRVSNDAYEDGGTGVVTLTDTKIIIGAVNNYINALRFHSVAFDPSWTLTGAHIEMVQSVPTNANAMTIDVRGELTLNALPIYAENYNISARTTTVAVVNYYSGFWSNANNVEQTADITLVVQEIIQQSGWTYNNSVLFFLVRATGLPTSVRNGVTLDSNPIKAATLVLDYTVPPPPPSPPTLSILLISCEPNTIVYSKINQSVVLTMDSVIQSKPTVHIGHENAVVHSYNQEIHVTITNSLDNSYSEQYVPINVTGSPIRTDLLYAVSAHCSEWINYDNVCTSCPNGGVCPGGKRVRPVRGFWSESERHIPNECALYEACPGAIGQLLAYPIRFRNGNDSENGGGNGNDENGESDATFGGEYETQRCANGYKGLRCSGCIDNYVKDGIRCVKCASNKNIRTAGIMIAAILVYGALAVCVVILGNKKLNIAALIFSMVQECIIVSKQVSQHYNNRTLRIFLNYSSLLVMDIDYFQPGCYMSGSFGYPYVFIGTVSLMVLVIAIFTLASLVRTIGWSKRDGFMERWVQSMFVMAIITYPQVAIILFQGVFCSRYEGELRLHIQPNMKCYEGVHAQIVGPVYFMIVLFVGFCIVCFVMTAFRGKSNTRNAYSVHDTSNTYSVHDTHNAYDAHNTRNTHDTYSVHNTRNAYDAHNAYDDDNSNGDLTSASEDGILQRNIFVSWLIRGLHPRAMWFRSTTFFVSLSIAAIIVFLSDKRHARIRLMVLALVNCIILVMVVIFKPYTNKYMNRIAAAMHVAIILFICVLLFAVGSWVSYMYWATPIIAMICVAPFYYTIRRCFPHYISRITSTAIIVIPFACNREINEEGLELSNQEQAKEELNEHTGVASAKLASEMIENPAYISTPLPVRKKSLRREVTILKW